MRRGVVLLGLILVFISGFTAAALAGSPFADPPQGGGWTSEAIRMLGERRDIPGFSVPAEPNRSQEALLVARLLQHISGEDRLDSRRFGVSRNVYLDDMVFTYNQRVEPEKAFTASEVESLYRLVIEFRAELEVLGYAVQDFELLYAQNWAAERGFSLTRRPLVYSEQALAAARKAEAARFAPSPVVESAMETMGTSEESRNVWTGQFSSASRLLPPAISLVAQEEPQSEQVKPIQIGNLLVTGALRATPPGSSSLDGSASDGSAGYGLSVKVGDVSLQTAVDLALDPQLVPKATSTSLDVSWDWANMFTLSAGYKLRERLQDDAAEQDDPPLVTSLGVTLPMNRGQVRLGMTQEWNFSELGGLAPGSGESMNARNVAELGLSYQLFNDSSLHFNYRLIDFSSVERDMGAEAEAAFSIKF
ncbi:MAG: hypothetical protein ACOX46_01470 [Limnochordia bacterium]|nr:hypothetical protein [Bacillota bacterium]NLL08509.1 hypothetical protein [Bacillota bacterium]HBG10243.1 hypothetical protein [Bacillota bacterium]